MIRDIDGSRLTPKQAALRACQRITCFSIEDNLDTWDDMTPREQRLVSVQAKNILARVDKLLHPEWRNRP